MRSSAVTGAAFLAAVLFFVAVRDGHCAQLCMDSSFPRTVNGSLSFCGYNGTACCNATDDAAVRREFAAMNISGTPCGDMVKSILCAVALIQRHAEMRSVRRRAFHRDDEAADGAGAVQLHRHVEPPEHQPGGGGLLQQGVGHLQGRAHPGVAVPASSSSTQGLLGGAAAADGRVAVRERLLRLGEQRRQGAVLRRRGRGVQRVPANSAGERHVPGADRQRVVPEHGGAPGRVEPRVPEQPGRARVPGHRPRAGLRREASAGRGEPVPGHLRRGALRQRVRAPGLAFHPDFAANGRFFVSYSCDKTKSATCAGRCACNSDVGCDPAKLASDNGALPCQFQSVIAEYTANATTGSSATVASPTEVRRIMTMGLPFTTHHGGQILFGPADGYMYFMMGDGGSVGDPWNFAQNKKTLLGKIVRIDVDAMSSSGGFGSYGIPKDNPFSSDPGFAPEVYALGFKNPWRCSFDSKKPSYMYCADVGQAVYEEVDLIIKGGNYGWRVFEGTQLYSPAPGGSTPGGNTSAASIDAIGPVMGYAHSSVNSNVGSASITGGYVYRSMTDPCLNGRYLYADLYAKSMWAGIESPEDSGVYNVSSLTFSCSKSSPIPCDVAAGSALPSLGYIFSFGEDNAGDVYLLTSKGVYRVVDPAQCNYACPIKSSAPSTRSPSPAPSAAVRSGAPALVTTLLAAALLALLSLMTV
ncbi:hypothetical protein EJB05_14838, partial [Eragrostis curvula]